MTAAQHTPGPWLVGLEDSIMGVPFIQIETDERAICEVSATHDDTDNEFDILDEDRANARLIAAAPDLLGALRFILAFYEPSQRGLDTEAWKVAEATARAAVSKAEGRS